MIAAGVANFPSSPGSITIPIGFTANTVFLLSGSALADGFHTVSAANTWAVLNFGIVNKFGGVLNQIATSRAYVITGGGPHEAICQSDDAIKISSSASKVPVYRAVATALDASGLTLNFTGTLPGAKLYWVAIDGPTNQLTGPLAQTGMNNVYNLGKPGVCAMGLFAQQAGLRDNGTLVHWYLADVFHAGGHTTAWASSDGSRFNWDSSRPSGDFMQAQWNLNPAGGVSLYGGWWRELGYPVRNSSGFHIGQDTLTMDFVGQIWMRAEDHAWFGGVNANAAIVDQFIGITPTMAIVQGASSPLNGLYASSIGLTVPSLNFDVCMGISTDASGAAPVEFRFPDKSWVSGWDHTNTADYNAGTILFPNGNVRAVRSVAGSASVPKNFAPFCIGVPMRKPQILRYA